MYMLGDTIKLNRLQACIKQREMANLLGVHFTTVQYWEQGRAAPDIEMMMRIARLCGSTLSRMLSALDHLQPAPRSESAYRETARKGRKKREPAGGSAGAD